MSTAVTQCPFLVPVTADRLWLYPVSAFCRAPDRGVRVPAPRTLELTCSSPAHTGCPGFLVRVDKESTDAP
jgi:hypothetical protein